MSAPSSLENGMYAKRTAVEVRGMALAILSFQTLGIIYSDIGTSPLYVLNGIWPATGPVPPREDVIGGISAIIWSLTLLPLIKYVFICLYFGTSEGEGGTYALFQGLFPAKRRDFDADRTLTGDSYKNSEEETSRLSPKFWLPLLVLSLPVFGTSLTLADGVFTPAVSVTSAVGGIAVAKPSVSSDTTGISIAFLVALFLLQPLGTSKIAWLFAPVTFVWLLLLAITGIVNITHFASAQLIRHALSCVLFVRTGDYDLLAGIVLAVTGCEALFANLGQFNVLSIQISFSLFVYPSLVLVYLGQGARLIENGEAILPNIFYNSIPGPQNGPLYWIVFVFALLATLIASQALISASFSLIQQLINMRNLPALHMVHTSETVQGQIYMPIVNWILMIVIIVVIAAFNNTVNLTNAYGFAVATVMLTTTCLVAVQFKYVKGRPGLLGLAFFLMFGLFDGLFWGASSKKIPHGAWVPLMIGIIMLSTILCWTWAKRLETKFDGSTRQNLRRIIFQKGEEPKLQIGESLAALGYSTDNHDSEKHTEQLDQLAVEQHTSSGASDVNDLHESLPTYYITDMHASDEKSAYEGQNLISLSRIETYAIFHKLSEGRGVPHSFVSFIRQWPALPRVVIFLSLRMLNVPRTQPSERYTVTKVRSVQGFYGVTYCLGFRDDFDVQITEIIERICQLEESANPMNGASIVKDIRAVSGHYTHIVPYYMIRSKNVAKGQLGVVVNWIRRFLLESVYYRISTMFPETVNWISSSDEIIHVGVNAYI